MNDVVDASLGTWLHDRSREHQRTNWPQHNQECKGLRKARLEIKKEMNAGSDVVEPAMDEGR
jgi:hypothetical protein